MRSSSSALTQQAVGIPRRLAGGAESELRGPHAAVAGCRAGAGERVHHAADRARAAAALGAAAETAIDPAGRARPFRLNGGAYILIAQHIARTDDHGAMALDGDLVRLQPNKRSVIPPGRYPTKEVAGGRHPPDGRE